MPEMVCDNPYRCAFDAGIIETIGRRFDATTTVTPMPGRRRVLVRGGVVMTIADFELRLGRAEAVVPRVSEGALAQRLELGMTEDALTGLAMVNQPPHRRPPADRSGEPRAARGPPRPTRGTTVTLKKYL
jgi:hypothetical protein